MRVLLIRPYSTVFTKPYFTSKPPLNLAYLSAYLNKHGNECRIVDYSLNRDNSSLRNILKSFQPHLIGVNAYTPNVLDGFELLRIIKSITPKYPTVIGGPHSTSLPEETMEVCPELDFVVIGEGEETLLDLCKTIERRGDPGKVNGICYRDNGKIIRTTARKLIELLDDLPFPDRQSIAHYYNETRMFDHNLDLPLNKIMDVITSRGCTDFCTFCTVHRAYAEKGRSLRLRGAENVLQEIAQAKSKFSIRHVSFLDDSFTIKRSRIEKIIYGLRDMKLTWNCDTRVNLVDRDLIHEMVACGCRKISIGVESGSEKVLKLINKNITIEQVKQVFKWCHEAGIETIEANFMVGSHPDETMEDLNLTRRLIKELRPQKLLLSIIVPFPGTKVREQMLERNLIFSNDWRRYILKDDEPPPWRTTYFTSRQLKGLQDIILSEFYFSLRNIITTLRYIRTLALLKSYFFSGLDIIRGYLIYKIKAINCKKIIQNMVNLLSQNPAVFSLLRKIIEWNFITLKKVIKKELTPVIGGSGKKILDAPCGTGEFSHLFAMDSYVGIDISEKYIDYAIKHYKRKFYCRDACKNGFDNSYFDAELILGFLHHFDTETIDAALAETKRVLKKNGVVLLIEDAPVNSNYNFIGKFLQRFDIGSNIRPPEEYRRIIQRYFLIRNYYPIRNGFWDYSVFVLLNE